MQKVVPQFSQRVSIMAWEPGNELKLDHQPTGFVNFMLKVAGQSCKGWRPINWSPPG